MTRIPLEYTYLNAGCSQSVYTDNESAALAVWETQDPITNCAGLYTPLGWAAAPICVGGFCGSGYESASRLAAAGLNCIQR